MLYEDRSLVLAALSSIGSMLLAKTVVETMPARTGRLAVSMPGRYGRRAHARVGRLQHLRRKAMG